MPEDRRSYRSPVRREHAELTRTQVVQAAYGCFVHGAGYTKTTMTQLAAAAGVSTQTLYNGFGSKARLLKTVYDVHLAGDDEPIPMAERPEFRALAELTDPPELLRAYARIGRVLLERVGPLMAMILEGAAAGDADLAALVETTGRERLVGAGGTVDRVIELGGLRPGLARDTAVDLIWMTNSFQVWDLLVRQRGWTAAAYADYAGQAMIDAIL